MPKMYKELRKELYGSGIEQKDIAKWLGFSVCYVSQRMNGKHPWAISDCYIILENLGVPQNELPTFFPSQDSIKSAKKRKGKANITK